MLEYIFAVFIYHIHIHLFMLRMKDRLSSFLTERQVIEFLTEYPEYAKTFQRAIMQEEFNQNNPNYYGWEWSDVGTMGSKLVRLVTNDMAIINFKSNRTTLYLLSNRQVIKEGLEKFQSRPIEIKFDVGEILKEAKKKVKAR